MNREKILNAIRQNKPGIFPDVNEPEIPGIIAPDGLKELFIQVVKQVGGAVTEFRSKEETEAYIRENLRGSLDFETPELWNEYSGSCPIEKLAEIETAILHGQTGVAENGAIWIDETNFPNRLIPFIVQQLFIKLPVEKIVPDMHAAYAAVTADQTGFGLFLSGPSKTADIEQSLVYGAHGAKGLTVLLYHQNNKL